MKTRLLFILFINSVLSNESLASKIDLTNVSIVINDFSYYIEDVVVVQPEKDVLGLDILNRTHLSFDSSIQTELVNYFKRHLVKAEGKKPLIVKVNKLLVHEEIEQCVTQLGLSLFTLENGQTLHLMNTGVVNFSSWSDLLSSSKKEIPKNLMKAFQYCFFELKEREKANRLLSNIVRETAPFELLIDSTHFPVFSHRNPRRGVFHYYGDFLDDKIDDSVSFDSDFLPNSMNTSLKVNFKGEDMANVWGVCDGDNYYYKFGKKFYLLEPNLDQHSFILYLESKDVSSNAEMGGAIGGLIGEVVVRAYESATSSLVKMEMDILTGNVVKTILDGYIVLDCGCKINAEKVCVSENDKAIICLNAMEFSRLPYKASDGIRRIKLTSGALEKEVLFDPHIDQNILFCRTKKTINVTEMEVVDPVKFEAILTEKKREVFAEN
jgi:hypothetical protein